MWVDPTTRCYYGVTKQQRKKTGKSNRKTKKQTVSSSVYIPPRNYLSTHIPGITQSLRRTLVGSVPTYFNVAASSFNEITAICLNSAYRFYGTTNAFGYDKYMQFYSKCFVHGARIKWKASTASMVSGANYHAPLTWGITITTFSTALTNVAEALQNGLTSYEMTCLSPNTVTLTEGVDVGKFINVPNILNDPQLFSTFNSQPAQFIYAHCWVDSRVPTVTPLVIGTLEIEFDCTFTDPIPFT